MDNSLDGVIVGLGVDKTPTPKTITRQIEDILCKAIMKGDIHSYLLVTRQYYNELLKIANTDNRLTLYNNNLYFRSVLLIKEDV